MNGKLQLVYSLSFRLKRKSCCSKHSCVNHARARFKSILVSLVLVSLAVIVGGASASAAQTALTYPAGVIPESIATADFNRDGNPDVVVTNYFAVGSITVLLGNGDGTLQEAKTFYLPGNSESPSYLTVGDFNKDGNLDLAVAGVLESVAGSNSGVEILLGNGDGTFQQNAAYAFFPFGYGAASVEAADLNQDSNPDLAVGVTVCTGVCRGAVALLIGHGDGTFHLTSVYDSGGQTRVSLAIADLNDDHHVDIAAVNDDSGDVGILLGNGNGTFQPVVSYPTGANRPNVVGGYSFLVKTGDLTGDGNLDLAVANGCMKNVVQCNGIVSILPGNGDGSFQQPRLYASGGWLSTSVAVADLNADGTLDVAVSNECSNKNCRNGTVGVLLNNSQGTFLQPQRYSSGGWVATSTTLGDFNRDGKPDLAVSNFCADENDCSQGTVRVLLGAGDGTFTQ